MVDFFSYSALVTFHVMKIIEMTATSLRLKLSGISLKIGNVGQEVLEKIEIHNIQKLTFGLKVGQNFVILL